MVDGEPERDEQDDVPGVRDREERGDDTERDLAEAPRDAWVERLVRVDHVEQQRAHGQVDHRERDERNEVVEELQLPDVSSREPERGAGGSRRNGE